MDDSELDFQKTYDTLILGVTLDTVKIRLHRAREKLKEELWTHCDFYWVEENEFVPDLKSAIEEFRRTN